MLQFNRSVACILGDELLDLRVGFSVEKEMTDDSTSKASIKLYNLSPMHRQLVETQAKNQRVRLSVGYGGQNKLLCDQAVNYADTARVGADIITTLEMWGGQEGRSTVFAAISGAVNDYQILQVVLNAFNNYGFCRGHISDSVIAKLKANTHRGFSESGTASKFMGMITKRAGLRWNTHNKQINIFDKDEYEDAEMVLLNKDTGMLGVPSKMQQSGGYKLRALLNAELTPGKMVRVQSSLFPIHGDLKIIKSAFTGDSLEGDWYVDLETIVLGHDPSFVEV
jgi:hypothetical protein